MELPILWDGDTNGAGAEGLDITTNNNTANLANHPYLANNPYRDLANGDGNDEDNDGDDDIEIVASPTADSELIVRVDEEITGVADK